MATEPLSTANPGRDPAKALWSMAAVSRATGISRPTLRVWEKRYGVPKPERLPSGHRRYREDQVERIRKVARALEMGHRPSEVVHLEERELAELIRSSSPEAASYPAWRDEVFRQVRDFDREGVRGLLSRKAALGGIEAFLDESLSPLLQDTGKAWRDHRLDIRHEHLLTEVVVDLLRSLREPLESSSNGVKVLLAILPGESHLLGLHMAGLRAILSGAVVWNLGGPTPPEEVLSAARTIRPAAVGITVTRYSAGPDTAAMLNRLRDELDSSVELWIGGGGASELHGLRSGIRILSHPSELRYALEHLAA